MNDFFRSLGEAYEYYFLRDLSKVATGLLVLLTWGMGAMTGMMRMGFDDRHMPFHYNMFGSFGFWSFVLVLLISYVFGVFLQELFSWIKLFPLSPDMNNFEGYSTYEALKYKFEQDHPKANRILERLVITKHFLAGMGIVIFMAGIPLISRLFFLSRRFIVPAIVLTVVWITLVWIARKLVVRKLKDQEAFLMELMETKKPARSSKK